MRQSNAPRCTHLTHLGLRRVAGWPLSGSGGQYRCRVFGLRTIRRSKEAGAAPEKVAVSRHDGPKGNGFRRNPGPFASAALPVQTLTGGVYARSSLAFSRADTFARMTKPIAYVETTIPNFYYDTRPDPAMVARRIWTREWWNSAPEYYELLSSDVVVEELEAGTSERVSLRLELVNRLRLLKLSPLVAETVQVYLHHKLMPRNPEGDALHLALASHHQCDFIVTWNCKHLANANKFAHIRKINTMLGLSTPEIVTPEELLRRNR